MLNDKNPLWLPKGSIRSVLAVGVVGAYVYVCVKNNAFEALGLVAVMIARDYFEKREG